MTRAFAYLRVSGKGQVEGDGFPRQLAAIKAYAKTNNVTIAHVFREVGVSGARESMDRPAWTEMVLALQSNGVRTVVIEKLDRLARDLMVQEATIADLRKRGVTLVSVHDADSDDVDQRFRSDGDHYSGVMPISVGAKRRWTVS